MGCAVGPLLLAGPTGVARRRNDLLLMVCCLLCHVQGGASVPGRHGGIL